MAVDMFWVAGMGSA